MNGYCWKNGVVASDDLASGVLDATVDTASVGDLFVSCGFGEHCCGAVCASAALSCNNNICNFNSANDLIGYWKFDDALGIPDASISTTTMAADSSGNNNIGTLSEQTIGSMTKQPPQWITAGKNGGALAFGPAASASLGYVNVDQTAGASLRPARSTVAIMRSASRQHHQSPNRRKNIQRNGYTRFFLRAAHHAIGQHL